MLMLGREVTLPVDLLVEQSGSSDVVATTDFAEQLRCDLQQAHERARRSLGRNARRQKKNYDRRAADPRLQAGEFVWLYNPAKKKGVTPKLQLKWEGPFLVLKKLSDVVYRIQRSRGSKPLVVHVDRLKPYQGDPIKSWVLVQKVPPEEPADGQRSAPGGESPTASTEIVESCDGPLEEVPVEAVVCGGDGVTGLSEGPPTEATKGAKGPSLEVPGSFEVPDEVPESSAVSEVCVDEVSGVTPEAARRNPRREHRLPVRYR